VAFGWFAVVAGSERAMAFLEAAPSAQLIAPDLVLVELLNAGWKAERMGAITAAQFQAIAELAPGLFSELVPPAPLLSAAQRWCRTCQQNILSAKDGQVAFRIKTTEGEAVIQTVPGVEFLCLLLQHVPPRGCRRVRDCGKAACLFLLCPYAEFWRRGTMPCPLSWATGPTAKR